MIAFMGQSAILAIAIRRSKAKRAKHMPRHNEAEKSGGDDCKDHERDDVLHGACPNTPPSSVQWRLLLRSKQRQQTLEVSLRIYGIALS